MKNKWFIWISTDNLSNLKDRMVIINHDMDDYVCSIHDNQIMINPRMVDKLDELIEDINYKEYFHRKLETIVDG